MSSSADLISAMLALLTVTVGSGSVASESVGAGCTGGDCVATRGAVFVAVLVFFAMRMGVVERGDCKNK